MNAKRLAQSGGISYPRPRIHPMAGPLVWSLYAAVWLSLGVAIGAAMWGK